MNNTPIAISQPESFLAVFAPRNPPAGPGVELAVATEHLRL
jgi:hypothetical protein